VTWQITSDGMHETATATVELTAGQPMVAGTTFAAQTDLSAKPDG